MKPSVRKFLWSIVRLLFSLIALYFVFRQIEVVSLGKLIKQTHLLLLTAACAFFILSKVLSSLRLNKFFHSVNINLDQLVNLRLYWLGMFYNLFLPGGIGGDGYKVLYLKKKMNTPVKKAVGVLLFDRFTGLLALGILVVILTCFLFYTEMCCLLFWLPLVLIILVFCFYFLVHRLFKAYYQVLHFTNILSLGVQIAQLISALLILLAIGNSHNISGYLLVFLISSVVAMIPFTVGGMGAREITFLYAAEHFHLDIATAIALSLMFFSITTLVSLPGVWYLIQPKRIYTVKHGLNIQNGTSSL